MPRTVRQPFDPRGEYVARREFKANGHRFAAGDDFPWRRLAIDRRKLYKLWDLRFIDVKGGDLDLSEPLTDTPDSVEESGEELVEEQSEDSVEEDVEKAEFIFDPEVHTLDNPGRGKYLILKAGDTVLEINRKEWKRLDGKEKPTKVNPDRVISG